MKEKIKKELLELIDEDYKKFHTSLCPGVNNMLGIRVPILRNYAKKLIKENKWIDVLNNIDDQYYEETMLQGMIIGLIKNENINIIIEQIKKFIPKINNWAVCDVFCSGLKITKKHMDDMWEFISKYINSKKEFELRFAIVMILDYYINEEHLQDNFNIFSSIKHDGYYVKMAIAWAISICLIKYYDDTLKYLKNAKIDKWTYNKSIQKAIESYRISDDRKEYLRTLKK